MTVSGCGPQRYRGSADGYKIALGSWADEMDDMPLPCKLVPCGAVECGGLLTYLCSLYVMPDVPA